jgi:hypothetical protein
MRPSFLVLVLLLASCGAAPGTPADATDVARAEGPPPRPLSIGTTEARFAEGDATDAEGAHVHVYRVTLDASRRVRVHLRSQEVDPLVRLTGPSGQTLENDDAFPNSTLDAMLDFVPPESGTYELRATTAGPNQRGAYTISVTERDPSGVGAGFALGQGATAELGAPTQPGLPGTWLHFEGQGGSIVRLRVTSRAFDTVATLIGPGGQVWMNDDANDVGPDNTERALDSTLIAALPQSGVYQLVVTSYGRGAGPFAVRSTVRPPVVRTAMGRPDGVAGPDGGRLLGLYLGITAYQDQSPLYGCADDARLLAEALRATHLQDQRDQLVLPDGLATREAFLNGVAQLASQARPQDVVLVFYSGHGQQVPDTDTGAAREIDGLDETLVLYDGSITDDDVVRALDSIGAGTVILAVDACHSGGFAADFVTRPGRMGLFSSDEDVLSDTAEPHRAGGYLSWHLRRGVLGEADARPRDGVLSAGELSDYILDGFVADHRLMNPRILDRAQRLDVRRGAVGWDHLLWIYPRNEDLSLPRVPDLPLTSHPPR